MELGCLDSENYYDVAKTVLAFLGPTLRYTDMQWSYEGVLCKEAKLHVMIAERFCEYVKQYSTRIQREQMRATAEHYMGLHTPSDITHYQLKQLTQLLAKMQKKAYRQNIIQEMAIILEARE